MTLSTLYGVFKANFGVKSSKQVTFALHTISRLLCRMKERYARTWKFPLSLTQGHWAQVFQQLPLSQYLGFIVLSTPSYLRLQTSVRVDFGHNRYSISKRFQLQPAICWYHAEFLHWWILGYTLQITLNRSPKCLELWPTMFSQTQPAWPICTS